MPPFFVNETSTRFHFVEKVSGYCDIKKNCPVVGILRKLSLEKCPFAET